MYGMAPPSRGLAALAIACTLALVVIACARASDEAAGADGPPRRRIVTVGGAVTETVFALGAGDRVIACDSSSTYPAAVDALPKIGYQRTLAAEPILALDPDLVIAAPEAGPAAALEQLRGAGVRVEVVPEASSPSTVADRTMVIAAALGDRASGRALADRIDRDGAAAAARAATATTRPRVLFLYARGAGNLMVSGTGTAADAILELAGAINVIDGYEGFRPLSAEALVVAAPEIILMPAGGLESAGGVDGILAMPGVAETPAGRSRRILAMDDLLLLGFGPRLPQAIDELARTLATP